MTRRLVVAEEVVVAVRVPAGLPRRTVARLLRRTASAAFRRSVGRAVRAALGASAPPGTRVAVG